MLDFFILLEIMMLKNRIAVLVAGALLGTQVGIAAEEEPEILAGSVNDQYVVPELATAEPVYLAQPESDQITRPEPQAVAAPMLTAPLISAIPPGAEELASKLLPGLAKYLDERAARLQTAAVRGDSFPPGADELVSQPLPGLAKYLDQRAAQLQTAAVHGDSFPPGADELVSKPLPGLVHYFDRKEANANVASYKRPASSSIE